MLRHLEWNVIIATGISGSNRLQFQVAALGIDGSIKSILFGLADRKGKRTKNNFISRNNSSSSFGLSLRVLDPYTLIYLDWMYVYSGKYTYLLLLIQHISSITVVLTSS